MKKKLILLLAPMMLLSCEGSKEPTYTITFNCTDCKAYDESDKEVTSVTVPAVDPTLSLCKEFHFEVNKPFKVPLKSDISIKKTGTDETVECKYVNGNLFVPIIGNLTISVTGSSYSKSLEGSSWDEIAEIAETGRADEFFGVGNTKEVTLKGQSFSHTVRIIDFNHDDLADGSGKAGITFEFADLISDENGYSLASLWEDDTDGEDCNFDYLNSTIRKNLVGYENDDLMWYEKDSATKSSRSQSVLDMLPNDLRSVLKIAKKKVNHKTTGSWVETNVYDELFLLSANEMNKKIDYAEKGEAYEYYKNAKPEEADPIRIKQQVKGTVGARTNSIDITDTACGSGYSYAGYNSSIAGCGSGFWLRSPSITGSSYSWNVGIDGEVDTRYACAFAYPIAPAFCI
ncbi:MAG: DUF6273 domain-containing protein [Bacilli bacterium]|nr:DUF6273 domain-containing protein [Bacilli bacterium]